MSARLGTWLFSVMLAAFELFLCTIPLLPNGDGPVHIYLSQVLWKLATHSSPLYAHYYSIRHFVQPYSFHYYFLILLEHKVSPDTAEKLFTALIWATLAFGFRALSGALSPGKPFAALLIFPFLLSWPLSAGFFNFTFAAGLLLFALAFYLDQRTAPFLTILVLLILAHPIPLLVLICLLGLDLALQLLASRLNSRDLTVPRRQALAFALACAAFVFPVLIADKAAVASSVRHIGFHFLQLSHMLSAVYTSFFQVHSPLGWIYQGLFFSLFPATLLLLGRSGLTGRLRRLAFTVSERLLLAALLFLLATLFLPESMNGSAFFAARMWYLVWLILAACLPTLLPSASAQRTASALAVGLALLSLGFAFTYLRPLARQQAALEQAPLPPHARGLFIQSPSATFGKPTHTWWYLNYWDGVRAFTAHDDVLVNTPWLQLTIVPVAENGRAGLLRDLTPNLDSESPNLLLRDLTPANRAPILALADFLLLADPDGTPPRPLALAVVILGPQIADWRCVPHDFYAVCERK